VSFINGSRVRALENPIGVPVGIEGVVVDVSRYYRRVRFDDASSLKELDGMDYTETPMLPSELEIVSDPPNPGLVEHLADALWERSQRDLLAAFEAGIGDRRPQYVSWKNACSVDRDEYADRAREALLAIEEWRRGHE
jgi:hypothetical protein